MKVEKEIKAFAEENNIIAGVCDSKPLMSLDSPALKKDTPFLPNGITESKRCFPKETMPECNSIIVIGVGYNQSIGYEADGKIRGELSLGAVGRDYHIRVKNLLSALVDRIKGITDFKYMCFVDTGPLIERELAIKAGLGFLGRNTSVISKKFGSFFNIGYILTDLSLNPWEEIYLHGADRTCCFGFEGECRRCIESCPTGALGNSPKDFDYKKCISFLTQKKGDLTQEEKYFLGNSIYGCDICQRACPHNTGSEFVGCINNIEEKEIDLEGLLQLSNKQFAEKYREAAFCWVGKKIMQRNARAVMENLLNPLKGIKP